MPFLNIGPGEFVKEELEVRGWNQEDLADIIGVSLKTVNKIIKNKQSITIDTARLLSQAFGQSAQYWMNLDTNYRLRELPENEAAKDVQIKSIIYKYMPIKEMIKKGWIKNSESVKGLIQEVIDFWKIDNLDFNFLEESAKLHFRKSEAYQRFNAFYALTWFQMARKVAGRYTTNKFDRKGLKTISENFHHYTTDEDGVNSILRDLNNIGVKFFLLSHLQKTYIDGSSFCDKCNPVIVYTARYDRIDNFWFTVAHEIAHILNDIHNEDEFFIDDLSKAPTSKKEENADNLAKKMLRINQVVEFFEPLKQYISEVRVIRCSNSLEIDPAVIVGALQHHGWLSHTHLNKFKTKVSQIIPARYFCH